MTTATGTWELVIGLEVHVQLLTATKIFCSCPTSFGAEPNRHTCPVCLGLPGALPVLNREAVALAVRAALALGCEVPSTSVFARKNYFYPDLPKGYQISQFDRPLAIGGALEIAGGRQIRLTRIHMEEDAGKSVHDRYAGHSAIDLNRAGTPLIEIVSEPDLRSAADARDYAQRLKAILEYARISDANMEEGSLRVDANVSIRRAGEATLGTKTEIKNMNSFSSVERAINTEFARQVALLESGGRIVSQTLLFDADRNEVRPQRSKEESHDYRYFPDPDLPPLILAPDTIERERQQLPELPQARSLRYQQTWGVSPADAAILTASREVAEYFDALAAANGDGKAAATWVIGDVLAWLNYHKRTMSEFAIAPVRLAALLHLVRDGVVSRTAGKRVFELLTTEPDVEPRALAEREGLLQVRDDDALGGWVSAVLAAHPAEVERLRAGEKKLIGVLVGAVMKASGGSADPRRVSAMITEKTAGPT